MLSDIGVEQAIIQNKKGEDADFVNTAWTLQVIRGGLIALVCCLLAIPAASFYQNPDIASLLPAIGLSALISGMSSSNIPLLSRRLGAGRLAALDIGTSLVSLIAMIVLAWMTQSVWALVIGNILGASFKTLCSHLWLDGTPNRFILNAQHISTLLHFGAWIFVSTALTFLVGEGNRLIIGAFVSTSELAFFSLAMTLTLLPLQIIQQLGARVLLPAYSEVLRERPEAFYNAVLKVRIIQILPAILISLIYICLGRQLVSALYDPRYEPVAPMLNLLAMGIMPQTIIASYGPLFLAKGLVRRNTALLAYQLLVQSISLTAGALLGGVTGLLLGLSLSHWFLYPVYALFYSRASLWQPKIDMAFCALAGIITFVNIWIQFGR